MGSSEAATNWQSCLERRWGTPGPETEDRLAAYLCLPAALRLCGWRVPASFPEYCRAVVPNVKSLTSSTHSTWTLLGMQQFWGQPTNAATPR